MLTCLHCQTEHPEAHYDRIVHNRTPLYGPWAGWRLAGQHLVAPDGTRFTPERLRGLAWQMETSDRVNKATTRNKTKKTQLVKIIVVNLADYRAGTATAAA